MAVEAGLIEQKSAHSKIVDVIFRKSQPYKPVLTRKVILLLSLGFLFWGLVNACAMYTSKKRVSSLRFLFTVLFSILGASLFNMACAYKP